MSDKVTKPLPRKQSATGVRELMKQESQHKIMVAARELFAELGYDRATLRQIAAKAGLTVGALFNHVTDKRDLIYLIFNAEVDTLTENALAAPRSYQTLTEKLLSIAEHYFRLGATEPVLMRILLAEVVVETPGLHLERYLSTRNQLLNGFADLVREAQGTGEIQATESPDLIALHIFYTSESSLRWWLRSSPHPEWRGGLREYERFLRLQMDGIANAPAASGAAAVLKPARADGKVARSVGSTRPAVAAAGHF